MSAPTPAVDLNADLGEGFGRWGSVRQDEEMLHLVSSASIACGFHAGDPDIMVAVTRAASRRGVRIGAHVGYRDLHGFGRRALQVDPRTLLNEAIYQIGALQAAAKFCGTVVSYLKPHGALYHAALQAPETAEALAAAAVATSYEHPMIVLGPAGTELERAARRHNLPFEREGFADRHYNDDGTLVPREQGGLITDSDAIVEQGLHLARGARLLSAQGNAVSVVVDTICLHGDGSTALTAARSLTEALHSANIRVEATRR